MGNRQYCDKAAGAQTNSPYQQGTHTYIINGKHVTCTTSGTVTNCF